MYVRETIPRQIPVQEWITKITQTTEEFPSLGWGLLRQFPPFRYFPIFSALPKHTLDIEYYVYLWQVSPQLSCGDTCQIWMWFKSNSYFCKIENFAYGEINERSFSNPQPWSEHLPIQTPRTVLLAIHVSSFKWIKQNIIINIPLILSLVR